MFNTPNWLDLYEMLTFGIAIDFFQEHVLRQGPQDNETALEQLKDKKIADSIKHGFKRTTGFDLPGTKH